ncbi:hypothetical protein K4L44_15590 [Halosquirtibacter laminarini]|uniref:Uncharacterized protein n=1 Tax=Halosquirtibacter laminarini TaxID=3374600 RepID=A0AC61NEC3_9BACT|nr:hypothetical protein K4L44_15590 [Prolixibacteraceae bacterium]
MKRLLLLFTHLFFYFHTLQAQDSKVINSSKIIQGEMATFRVGLDSETDKIEECHWLIINKKKDDIYFENKIKQSRYTRTWNDCGEYTIYSRVRDISGCVSSQIFKDFEVIAAEWEITSKIINKVQCSMVAPRTKIGRIIVRKSSFNPIEFNLHITATVDGVYKVIYNVEDGKINKVETLSFKATRRTEGFTKKIVIPKDKFRSLYTNTDNVNKTLTISIIEVKNPSDVQLKQKKGSMGGFKATIKPQPRISFK